MAGHGTLAAAAAAAGKGKSGQNDDNGGGHKNPGKTTSTCQCGTRRPLKAHLRTCSSTSKMKAKRLCSLSCTRRRELATASGDRAIASSGHRSSKAFDFR